MAENTLEAFGMTRAQMEEANQRAADQMLPMPYDIPGEEAPVQENRFGDTAEWAAKDAWEEAKRRFQVRGTEEGAAGAFPEADSGVLNTFTTGLGYAADMGLAGLEASDAAWKYSVGLASELVPGMDRNQERRFTRDVSSVPEAFAGNVFGVNAGVPLPTASQASTGVRMATGDVLDAMPEYDPTRVNIFGGLGATDPGYTQSGRKAPESTGADGKYRFEMDDSNISVVPSNVTIVQFNPRATPKIPTNSNISTLGDVMVADELFYQYPDIQNTPIVFNSSFDPSHRGSAYSNNVIALNSDFLQKPPEEFKKTLIHEIQHLIQAREGFAQGTSPENRDVLAFARGEIDSPENTQAWAEYNQDLANYRKNENLVEPLQRLKSFYESFAARNDFLLREPRMLQRVSRRLRGRDSELPVQLNLISDVEEVENILETLDSANPDHFDYLSGRVSGLLKKANSLAGDQDADILEETLNVNPVVFKPGGSSDILEYFIPTPAPSLPDLPPPGGSPDTSVLFRTYERKRGEVEARNAADRMSMTLEERLKTSPESTEDPRMPRPYQWGEPSNYNKGGLAVDEEMKTMRAEGGIKDDGMNRDPVSGNEIPAGSLAEEVRDDVDAKLSSGEYVVPADVVRFFGVEYFEKLRNKAKAGLEKMEADGRIGGEPSPMKDDLPFKDEELQTVEDTPVEMAEGGSVASTFNPQQYQPGFSFGTNQGQATGGTISKVYTNAAGEIRSILFVNGQPITPIPEGFVEATPENRASMAQEEPTQTSGDRDRDRGPRTPSVTAQGGEDGEGFGGFKLSEEDQQKLQENPLSFGMESIRGDETLNAKRLGGAGSVVAGAPGMVLGAGVGGGFELENVARARAALRVAEDQNLEGTEDYKKLREELDRELDNLSGAGKILNTIGQALGFATGENYARSAAMTPQTVQAIPTGSSSGSERQVTSGGVNYTQRSNSDDDSTYSSRVTTGSAAPSAPSVRPTARPWTGRDVTEERQSSAEKAKEARERADRAASSLGTTAAYSGTGRATGGLVQKPKKKKTK